MTKTKIGELVMRLLHARTAVHVLHLTTRSYAQHMALDELYNALTGHIDIIAEAYQGRFDALKLPDIPYVPPGEAVATVGALRLWVETNREVATRDNDGLESLVDDLVVSLDSALFKLRFLS